MVAPDVLAALEAVLDRFEKARVAVLGDIAADEYIVGRPARISREAPVLILEYSESFVRPGGAANPANNVARLGAVARMIGTVGADAGGQELTRQLSQSGIDVSGIVTDPTRPTAMKTRVLARGTQEVQQQIVRIDRVQTSDVSPAIRDRMMEATCRALEHADALLISDYESGVISQPVIDVCLAEARKRGLVIVVDSHGDLYRFQGVTAATPNQPEAAGTVGRTLRTDEDVHVAGEELVRHMHAGAVLITRGSEGIALFQPDRAPWTLPVSTPDLSTVVDPTGAGDTVAAVFTLALCSGAGFRQAALLANVAGGQVVRRLGAATLTLDDLRAAVRRTPLNPPDL